MSVSESSEGQDAVSTNDRQVGGKKRAGGSASSPTKVPKQNAIVFRLAVSKDDKERVKSVVDGSRGQKRKWKVVFVEDGERLDDDDLEDEADIYAALRGLEGKMEGKMEVLQYSVLSHGLPESKLTGDSTYTSAPGGLDAKGMEDSTFIFAPPPLEQQFQRPLPVYARNVPFEHRTEADVATSVIAVLEEVFLELERLDAKNSAARAAFRLVQELHVTQKLRPDAWVVSECLAGGAKNPRGLVEVKYPSRKADAPSKLDDENVLGQAMTYLRMLHRQMGVQGAFVLLTTYEEWRLCWLAEDVRAGAVTDCLQKEAGYTTDGEATLENIGGSSEENTLSAAGGEARIVQCSPIVRRGDTESIVALLFGAARAMQYSRLDDDKIGEDGKYFLLATSTHYKWTDVEVSVKEDNLPSDGDIDALYLGRTIQTAARHGVVSEACTKDGIRCAVKLCAHENLLEQELKVWRDMYGDVEKVGAARKVTLAKRDMLLMPWVNPVQHPTADDVKTLRMEMERFVERGWWHDDVAWRNVGYVVRRGVEGAAASQTLVMFDFAAMKQRCAQHDDDDDACRLCLAWKHATRKEAMDAIEKILLQDIKAEESGDLEKEKEKDA